MARTGHNSAHNAVQGADRSNDTIRNHPGTTGADTLRDQRSLLDDSGDDDNDDMNYDDNSGDSGDWERNASNQRAPLMTQGAFPENRDAQADFREQFDEDLYTDREDTPAQGNTADVAMGDRRFGSDGEAYAEYAHRRPGEDSSVGVSRDPADIAADTEDDETP